MDHVLPATLSPSQADSSRKTGDFFQRYTAPGTCLATPKTRSVREIPSCKVSEWFHESLKGREGDVKVLLAVMEELCAEELVHLFSEVTLTGNGYVCCARPFLLILWSRS